MRDKEFLLRLFVLHFICVLLILGSSAYHLRSQPHKKSNARFSSENLNGDIYVDSIYESEPPPKKTPTKPTVPLRTLTSEQQKQLSQWIELLGDENYKVREATQQKILQLGRDALPYLETQSNHPDLQIRETLQELLSELSSE